MTTPDEQGATTPLVPLPTQPDGVPWPTNEWPVGSPVVGEPTALQAEIDRLMTAQDPMLGRTDALVVVQGGRIVAERYGAEVDAASTLISWSMAKSMTAMWFGMSGLDVSAPAAIAEWDGDDRTAITNEDLLRMRSGLRWTEEYTDEVPSDVVEMLFGEPKGDMAAFAASAPLAHEPGSVYLYSSGTSNIVAHLAARAIGTDGDAAATEASLRERLFAPIGMSSATPKFDDAGTFIGSSFVYATARDFARFGLLCLRGGHWDGEQLTPQGWVDWCRTPTEVSRGVDDFVHGAHFWCHEDGRGTFGCHGYLGQYIWMVPALDLIVVRLGERPEEDTEPVKAALRSIIAAFDPS